MAETRSSQSPTATLSDFVIGSFNTCRLELPNTATVEADGIPAITSNQALITILDGDDMSAADVGPRLMSFTATAPTSLLSAPTSRKDRGGSLMQIREYAAVSTGASATGSDTTSEVLGLDG
jgi:hypothetical protein